MFETFKSVKELPTLLESHHGRQSIALDAGSTETRGVIAATDDVELSDLNHISEVKMCELLSIPSGYASISQDTRLGKPSKYDSIADKLEYLIVKESGGDLGWTKQRILKGSLMKASSRSVVKVTSSLLKVQQPQTYINIIATIANMFLAKTMTTGKAFRQVMPVDLTVALPYEDIYAARSVEIFKSKLSGVYKVIFPRILVDKVNSEGQVVDANGEPISTSGERAKKIPYFVKFEINGNHITITSEQNAVAEYYETAFADEIEQEESIGGEKSKTVIIEVGGRNTAMLLNKQSGMDDSLQMTFDDAGSSILKDIKDSAIKSFDLTTVSEDQALQALMTGKMSYGSRIIDCIDIVNKAKIDFASKLYQNYTLFLDTYSTKVNDVKRVVVSGRSFKSIERTVGDKTEIISPSIKTFFESLFEESSPTEVISIGIDYPIPWGLITCRMAKLDGGFTDYGTDFDIDFDIDFD